MKENDRETKKELGKVVGDLVLEETFGGNPNIKGFVRGNTVYSPNFGGTEQVIGYTKDKIAYTYL